MAVIILKPEHSLSAELDKLKEPVIIKICGIDVRFTPSNIISYNGSRLLDYNLLDYNDDRTLIIIIDINNVLPFKHREIISHPIEYIDDPYCMQPELYNNKIQGGSILTHFMLAQIAVCLVRITIVYPNSFDFVFLIGNNYYVSMLPLHQCAREHPRLCERKRLRMTRLVVSFLTKAKKSRYLERAIEEITMESGPIDFHH